MKYRYTGDGPFPLYVVGHGTVNSADDVIETSEPINHVHFELVTEKKSRKESEVTDTKEMDNE